MYGCIFRVKPHSNILWVDKITGMIVCEDHKSDLEKSMLPRSFEWEREDK